MDTVLRRNGISLMFDAEKLGQVIIKVAQGIVDETELARHLRCLSQSEIEVSQVQRGQSGIAR